MPQSLNICRPVTRRNSLTVLVVDTLWSVCCVVSFKDLLPYHPVSQILNSFRIPLKILFLSRSPHFTHVFSHYVYHHHCRLHHIFTLSLDAKVLPVLEILHATDCLCSTHRAAFRHCGCFQISCAYLYSVLFSFLLINFHFGVILVDLAGYSSTSACMLSTRMLYQSVTHTVILAADQYWQQTVCRDAPCRAGAPLFPPCPFTSSSFPFFTFSFLSLALPIFFFCPSLPFLPEYSHSVSRPEVVGGDRTWVQFVFFV